MTERKVLITIFSRDDAVFKYLAAAVTFSIWRAYLLVDQALSSGRNRADQRLMGNQVDYDVAGERMNDE